MRTPTAVLSFPGSDLRHSDGRRSAVFGPLLCPISRRERRNRAAPSPINKVRLCPARRLRYEAPIYRNANRYHLCHGRIHLSHAGSGRVYGFGDSARIRSQEKPARVTLGVGGSVQLTIQLGVAGTSQNVTVAAHGPTVEGNTLPPAVNKETPQVAMLSPD